MMTTKHSPRSALKKQADQMAATIKAIERGEKVKDLRFAAKVAAARNTPSFKIGIAMDDKLITIDMPWATIRAASEAGLSEYIVKQMQEQRDDA